jgi:Protein of unknown function (DUF2939)
MQGFVHRPFAVFAVGLAAAAGLTGCGPRVEKDVAAQISVFLASAQTEDRQTFEGRIDRPAVRDDLRTQLTGLPGVKELQAQIGEGMSEPALDRLATPETVRRLAEARGPATTDAVRPRLRPIGGGRVCLRDAEVRDRCALTFRKIDLTWKLVGVYAQPQSFQPPPTLAASALLVQEPD